MIDLIAWLTNTASIGGIVIMTVFTTAFSIYILLLRWLYAAGQAEGESDASQ